MKVQFETRNDTEVAHVTFTCPFCGKETELVVDKDKFEK